MRDNVRPLRGLDALAADPARALGLPRDEAARLLAQAEGVAGILRAAVQAPPALPAASPLPPAPPGPSEDSDELLTATEVGALLKKPRHAVYGLLRSKELAPAVMRINRRTLRVRKGELMRRLHHP
jgi:hypothetical protein